MTSAPESTPDETPAKSPVKTPAKSPGEPAVEKTGPSAVARAGDAVLGVVRFFLFALKRFQTNQTLKIAASLGYTSMLAIVPLMAIGLAMLAAFPAFSGTREQIQSFIFENFAPGTGDVVQDVVGNFINAAGGLTAIGIVFLGVTAIMTLLTIEDALNAIFKVKEKRSFVSRLMVYWTILTLGPVLIGASFSLSGYLFALSHWAGQQGYAQSFSLFTRALPIILVALAFTLTYTLVPNRQVSTRAALIGGLCAGVMFGGLRFGFTLYVTNAQTYQTIYGALATLPIFMIWMYLSWAVILFGAEITAAVPEWRARKGRAYLASGSGAKLRTALEAVAALREESKKGTGLSRNRLLKKTAVPEGAIAPIMEQLEAAGFVAMTRKDTWVLVRDLEITRLNDLVRALGIGFTEDADTVVPRTDDWRSELERRIKAAGEAETKVLDTPISALLGDGGSVETVKAAQ